MTLKNAALLALIGTILITAFLTMTFVFTFLNVLRGVVPAVTNGGLDKAAKVKGADSPLY